MSFTTFTECLCCHPLVWVGAHGWVVDTADPGVVPSSRGWVAGQPWGLFLFINMLCLLEFCVDFSSLLW